jgi:hypothetical protein
MYGLISVGATGYLRVRQPSPWEGNCVGYPPQVSQYKGVENGRYNE